MEALRDALLLNPSRGQRTGKVLWEFGASPEPAAA
jgi:hypothetical protein